MVRSLVWLVFLVPLNSNLANVKIWTTFMLLFFLSKFVQYSPLFDKMNISVQSDIPHGQFWQNEKCTLFIQTIKIIFKVISQVSTP